MHILIVVYNFAILYQVKNNNTETSLHRGKLIVIDGGDGSGKTTQTHLLHEYLREKNIPVKIMDFPQYYDSFFGKTVAQFLRGEFGAIDTVSPYLVSLLFAQDRASVCDEMENFLRNSGYIICNRYATSSMAHQGAKFVDEQERSKFLLWLTELEYGQNKIPKEDIVIYLHVPWQVAKELNQKKGERAYLNGKKDIQENDDIHQITAQQVYLQLAKQHPHWITIPCTENNTILPAASIHATVVQTLVEKGIIEI